MSKNQFSGIATQPQRNRNLIRTSHVHVRRTVTKILSVADSKGVKSINNAIQFSIPSFISISIYNDHRQYRISTLIYDMQMAVVKKQEKIELFSNMK